MSITSHKNKKNGFTLVEVAIVIGIVGIIMMGLFAGMGAIRETVKFKQDQQKLQDIKQALISFASVNGHLPCPDTTGNGRENRDDGTHCTSSAGELPFLDLETHQSNAYGFRFRYIVNQQVIATEGKILDPLESASYFGNSCGNSPCFDQNTPPTPSNPGTGNYKIQNDLNENNHRVFADHIPLVVISHGQNGCPGESIFEQHNCLPNGNSNVFYQAQQNRNTFDDVLIWLSGQEIKTAMLNTSQDTFTPDKKYGYDFADMSTQKIADFISNKHQKTAGRNKENWSAKTDNINPDEKENSVDSLLTVTSGGEQIILIPIMNNDPSDSDFGKPFKQYKITAKARLLNQTHNNLNPGMNWGDYRIKP